MKTSQLRWIMLALMLPLLTSPPICGDDLGQAVQAAIQKVEPSIVRLRVIGGEQSIDGDAVQFTRDHRDRDLGGWRNPDQSVCAGRESGVSAC